MRRAAWVAAVLLVGVQPSLQGPLRADTPPAAEEPAGKVAVSVDETPEAVRLRIPGDLDLDPDSVEVLLAGRDVTVLARSTTGRRVRSRSVHVEAPLSEEGVTADYDADGSLTVTLRKQAAPDAEGH